MPDDSKQDDQLRRIIQLLQQILAVDQNILAGINKLVAQATDIRSLKVSVDKPTSSTGSTQMAVKSLGDAISVTMLDDQKTTMHIQPLDGNGNPTSLPTGAAVPTYASSDTTVVLTPAADGLSCGIAGVKGTAGTPTVTASFTNLDGTVATGSAGFTITIDPKELDVSSLAVTVDTPTAQ